MTGTQTIEKNREGSVWHRWDPHIHAPGTIKNNHFGGDDDVFDKYIALINAADPPIRALGVTDYYILDSYERVKAAFDAGRLPGVKLLFPNIELRFALSHGKGSPINVHLLINPDAPDHIVNSKSFLSSLKFEYNGEPYGCTNNDLIRLGKAFSSSTKTEAHALEVGANQAKVEMRTLREAFKNSQWARENILVGLAAGKNDGAAQLQEDGLSAIREEIQRLAHVIFSGNPSDRNFWLGDGALSREDLNEKYGGPKPCIHGCDAHELAKVGKPDLDRMCWIKGDLTFETLRQICFEPSSRVSIGAQPPMAGRESNTIKNFSATGTEWLVTQSVPINAGLVAVIGARGSGKTALVEMIAAGAESVDCKHTSRSFLERAQPFLVEGKSRLRWGRGEETAATINIKAMGSDGDPRVRYLSQQFVDQLCSSDGLADELVGAIEDVIFAAHPANDRLGARSFKELRGLRTQAVRRQMERLMQQLRELGEEISAQNDLSLTLPDLQKRLRAEEAELNRFKVDRKALTPGDNKEVLERLEKVREAAEWKSGRIAELERKELSLSSLQDDVVYFEEVGAGSQWDQLKANFRDAELSDSQWSDFRLRYSGDVKGLLKEELKLVRTQADDLRGPGQDEPPEVPDEKLSSAPPYFDEAAKLKTLTLSLLFKEQSRLEARVGVDQTRKRRYTDLSDKIVRGEAAIAQRRHEIALAAGAKDTIKKLTVARHESYKSLVTLIDKEEEVLQSLYKPLQERLNSQKGTLKKLTFSVRRIVDIDAWAEAGERLIDRSRQGQFRGVGQLTRIIKTELEDIWQNGTAEEIAAAMGAFREKYSQEFRNHAFQDTFKTRESTRNWFQQITDWLYSTDHVRVQYGLRYEDVDIQQLSPGTRGIVLLLLYLSIDINDERPLIIDQPEENLDPQSIFYELVGEFKEAKKRRQIIIVTHNANLVVNTDADQVIVATRGAHHRNRLPEITYQSGGLENPEIRREVCNILEGGKDAFEQRAKRLRMPL